MKKRMFLILSLVLITCLSVNIFSAEKIGIQLSQTGYNPGDKVGFKIALYDNSNNKINGKIDFIVQDFYTDVISQGSVDAWQDANFVLPANTIAGYAKIVAEYNNIEASELFNVFELGKAEIKLEGDQLKVTNTGNAPIEKKLSITIETTPQTAIVFLEVGQTKIIKLTAPDGVYDVKIVDEKGETIEAKALSLTGNIIGLESMTSGSFIKKYPAVILFIGIMVFLAITIFVIRSRK